MKKTFLGALSVCTLAGCSSPQKSEREIPTAVEATFRKDFPKIKAVEWEKDGSNYEAEFENGDTEMSAVYDSGGVLLETETVIEPDQLPKAAQQYVKANYPGKKIKEAAAVVDLDRKGTVEYEAEVDGKDLIFDGKGNRIQRNE